MAELRTKVAIFLRLPRIYWDIAPERMSVDGAKSNKQTNMLDLLLTHTLQWSSVHHKSREICLTPYPLPRNSPLS